MPCVLNDVRLRALELLPDERELLIHDLLVSLDDDGACQNEVDAARSTEIVRRSAEVHRGTAKLVEMDVALDRVLVAAVEGER